jgi:copper(I)-binding protein
MPPIRAALLALLLAAPAMAHDDHHHDDDVPHVFEAEGLRVVHPWAAATDGPEAMIYMEIENAGVAPARLLGASTEAAGEIGLVGHVLQDGEMVAMPLPELLLEPGTDTVLEPDGAAIRVIGLSAPLEEGHHLELTLITDGAAIPLMVAVEPAGARAHSHAGHAH